MIHRELFNVRTPALSPREIDKPCWSDDGSFGYSDQLQDALKQGSLKDIVDFFSRYRRGHSGVAIDGKLMYLTKGVLTLRLTDGTDHACEIVDLPFFDPDKNIVRGIDRTLPE